MKIRIRFHYLDDTVKTWEIVSMFGTLGILAKLQKEFLPLLRADLDKLKAINLERL